eukprot:5397466-Amphidinium_carterae.1
MPPQPHLPEWTQTIDEINSALHDIMDHVNKAVKRELRKDKRRWLEEQCTMAGDFQHNTTAMRHVGYSLQHVSSDG